MSGLEKSSRCANYKPGTASSNSSSSRPHLVVFHFQQASSLTSEVAGHQVAGARQANMRQD